MEEEYLFLTYKNEFIEIIKTNIEKKGTVSTADVKRMAYAMFGNMNFLNVYATIYRISDRDIAVISLNGFRNQFLFVIAHHHIKRSVIYDNLPCIRAEARLQ